MQNLLFVVALAAFAAAANWPLGCWNVTNNEFTHPPFLAPNEWKFATTDILSMVVHVPKMTHREDVFELKVGTCTIPISAVALAAGDCEWLVKGSYDWNLLTTSCGGAVSRIEDGPRFQTYMGKITIKFRELLTELVPGVENYRSVSHDLLFKVRFDRIVVARHSNTIWSKPIIAEAITNVEMKVTNIPTADGILKGTITYAIGNKFTIDWLSPLAFVSSSPVSGVYQLLTTSVPVPRQVAGDSKHDYYDFLITFKPDVCGLEHLKLTASVKAACKAGVPAIDCPFNSGEVVESVADFTFTVSSTCAIETEVVDASVELYAYKNDGAYAVSDRTAAYFINKILYLQGQVTSTKVTVIKTELVSVRVSSPLVGSLPGALKGGLTELTLFDTPAIPAPAGTAFSHQDDDLSIRDGLHPRFRFTATDIWFTAPVEDYSTMTIIATFRVTYKGNNNKRADAPLQVGTMTASFDPKFLADAAAAAGAASAVAPWF